MAETLFGAYLPLIIWTSLGLIAVRFIPSTLPRLLGRTLYWVGVPWEVFALARSTDLTQTIAVVPCVAIAALIVGLALTWWGLQFWQTPLNSASSVVEPAPIATLELPTLEQWRARRGSFLIAATIGNTGFVGLGIVPTLINEPNLGWAVFYSVTNNVLGTYGLGVFLASYYGRSQTTNHWRVQFRDLLTVPSLWAFILGAGTRSFSFPELVEQGLQASLWFVIPGAFLLMGMRLSQIKSIKSFQPAILPSVFKVLLLPVLVGIGTTLLGLTGEPRLALVLMAGMPSAFAGLILAEEYNLDRELIASSITLTTIALFLTIPFWLLVFC
jgi:hypothetical protein